MSAPEQTVRRLRGDYMQLLKEPLCNVWAQPTDENILEWYYLIRGPEDTPFFDGIYLGKIVFPKEYPLKAPAFYMITPNGKFGINRKICVAGISDFYPDKWSPAHTVFTILLSLSSFMFDENCGIFFGQDVETLSLVRDKRIERQKKLAKESWTFNLNNEKFCKYFKQFVDEAKSRGLEPTASTSANTTESQLKLKLEPTKFPFP